MIFITGGAYQGKLDVALSLFEEKDAMIVDADSLPHSWFSERIDGTISSFKTISENGAIRFEPMSLENLDHDSGFGQFEVIVVNHVERIATILRERSMSPEDAINSFLLNLQNDCPDGQLVLLADEVGAGVVPLGKETRTERELAGRLSTLLASKATQVIRVLAGVPMVIKG